MHKHFGLAEPKEEGAIANPDDFDWECEEDRIKQLEAYTADQRRRKESGASHCCIFEQRQSDDAGAKGKG